MTTQPGSYQSEAERAAAFINEQWVYAASALLAVHLGVEHPALRHSLEPAPGDEHSMLEHVSFKRIDGTELVVPFRGPIAFPLRRYRSRETFERTIVMGMISLAAAVLDEHTYFDRAPLLEFVRHLRNGISTGTGSSSSRTNPIPDTPPVSAALSSPRRL